MARVSVICLVIMSMHGRAVGQASVVFDRNFDPGKALKVKTNWPVAFDEKERTWTRSDGAEAFTARLGGRNADKFIFYFSDGRREEWSPNILSAADHAYALQRTAKRVNPNAAVVLGKITLIRNGDSFVVKKITGELVLVRLDGIDAPDSTQPNGPSAISWLKRFVGQDVRVEYFEIDKYKRLVANVFVDDRWLNFEMVLAGYAWHDHRQNVDGRLAAGQQHAVDGKRGMWVAGKPQSPWDYRAERARARRAAAAGKQP